VRKILTVLALILLAVGSLEFLFKQGTVDLSRAMVESDFWTRLAGIFALFFGVMLLIGAKRRVIGLTTFLSILGWYMVAVAAVLLVYPPVLTGIIYAIFLNTPHATQVFVVQLSGLIRIVLGGLLLYAIARPPRRETPPAEP